MKTSEANWLCINDNCGSCALSTIQKKENENATYLDFYNEYAKLGPDFGSTSFDRSLSKLSCHRSPSSADDIRVFCYSSTFISSEGM